MNLAKGLQTDTHWLTNTHIDRQETGVGADTTSVSVSSQTHLLLFFFNIICPQFPSTRLTARLSIHVVWTYWKKPQATEKFWGSLQTAAIAPPQYVTLAILPPPPQKKEMWADASLLYLRLFNLCKYCIL